MRKIPLEMDDKLLRVLHLREKRRFTFQRIADELGLSTRERARQWYEKARVVKRLEARQRSEDVPRGTKADKK